MTGASVSGPTGVVCPIVTPLTPDGRFDEPVFRALIDALVPDLDGLFVLGSSGELTWLPDDVALRVARVAVDQVAGRVPVSAGVGDTGLQRTLERADRIAATGVDLLVVAAPFYYAAGSDAALIEHWTAVADRAPAPVVLYNIPQNTHNPLSPSAVGELSNHPAIVGLKDSAGDWMTFAGFLDARSEHFRVTQGRERMAAVSLWSGADGVISAMANLAPRLLRELVRAVREDQPRSEILALQATIDELAAVFDQGNWLAGLKGTLRTLGWAVGEPSRPIQPYDAAGHAAVEAIVARPNLRPWLIGAPS